MKRPGRVSCDLNVLQYDGTPGAGAFRVGQFDAQAILLPAPPEFDEVLEESTLSTWSPFYSDDIAHRAELQWRISVLLLIPVIALIAVLMSRVSPRQGHYTKPFPALLVVQPVCSGGSCSLSCGPEVAQVEAASDSMKLLDRHISRQCCSL